MKIFIRYLLLICFIILFIIGYVFNYFNIMLISIIMLLVNNILYSLELTGKRVVFLFFNISFFTFLIGQYLFMMLNGEQWWSNYPNEIMTHTLLSLFISLLFLYMGSVFAELFHRGTAKREEYMKSCLLDYIRKISRLMSFISILFAFIVLQEKVIFVQQYGYTALYVDYTSQIPLIVKKIAQTYLTFLYIYLATMPRKKEARAIIILYLFYLGVTVLSGVRGPMIVGLLVLIIYCIFRDINFRSLDEKWLGKTEKTIIMISLPFFIAFLSAYNLIRDKINVDNFNILNEIIKFFTSQGGSVQVIVFSKMYENYLPSTNISYTMGPIINYFTIGSIASIFTGLTELVDKVDIAIYGNNLGATITYLVNSQYYLAGGGLGTQYIAELYADFGYLGIVIFNFIIGVLISKILSATHKKWWLFAIGLLTCNAIMEMPRNFALTWVGVWIALPTWIPILLTWLTAKLIYEKRHTKTSKALHNNAFMGDIL